MKDRYRSGMQGVYLVAAELTYRGFIVSPTLRNAFGADLLVTDPECKQAWSVQVKTNSQRMNYWLVGRHARRTKSPSHIYVFVTLKGSERPEFHVVPSEFVTQHVYENKHVGGTWYSLDRSDLNSDSEGWEHFEPDHQSTLMKIQIFLSNGTFRECESDLTLTDVDLSRYNTLSGRFVGFNKLDGWWQELAARVQQKTFVKVGIQGRTFVLGSIDSEGNFTLEPQ